MPAVVLGVALLAVTAGCGGQAADGPDRRQPPAAVARHAGFGDAADRLCASAQAEQEAIRRRRGGDQLTLDDRARLLVDLAPPRARLAAELDELAVAAGDRSAPRRLVAAAERRAAASRLAGELWQRGASEPRIAAAAAAEHGERERFVAIAGRLGLGDCAEVLSGEDRRQIVDAVELGLGSTAARDRCAALGERYLRERYEGAANCRRALRRSADPPASVTVRELQGIDGVFAVARATVGRGADDEQLRIRVVFEDGSYRIDKID